MLVFRYFAAPINLDKFRFLMPRSMTIAIFISPPFFSLRELICAASRTAQIALKVYEF